MWRVPLTADDSEVARLALLLTPEDGERIARRRDPTVRRSLTVCWGRVREILAAYVDISPRDVEIRRGKDGRPRLAETPPELRFSLSHSDDVGLLAVAADVSIGVDIERMREGRDVERLAARFLRPEERDRLLSREAGKSGLVAFYRMWTRKEALIKGLGLGVPSALRRVGVAAGEKVPELDGSPCTGWALYDLNVRAGYAAALAVASRTAIVRRFVLPDAP